MGLRSFDVYRKEQKEDADIAGDDGADLCDILA
jgi:hypothetical protein